MYDHSSLTRRLERRTPLMDLHNWTRNGKRVFVNRIFRLWELGWLHPPKQR